MKENNKNSKICTTFNLNGKTISFQLPIEEEIEAMNRASETNFSAWEAGGDFNISLQEKWERILLFLEELNLLWYITESQLKQSSRERGVKLSSLP